MNFHSPVMVYFEPLMILALLTALWDAKNRRFADVFLSLGWLHLALIAQRNLPIFAIAAAPLVARAIVSAIGSARHAQLAGWLGRTASWFTISQRQRRTDRPLLASSPRKRRYLCSSPARCCSRRSRRARSSRRPTIPTFIPEQRFPALLSAETHHIFAEDEWGDYLIYHLYPSKQVFIDGRSDFYGDEFGERYLDLMNVKYGWEKTLDKYDIDTIVLSPKFALTSTLKISRDWRVVYDDGVAVVFRRAISSPSRHQFLSFPVTRGETVIVRSRKQSPVIAGSLNQQPRGEHTK